MPGTPGFRRGQTFPEMNENLLNIFIFRDVFKKPFRTGGKTLVFVNALHLSPRISLLNACIDAN